MADKKNSVIFKGQKSTPRKITSTQGDKTSSSKKEKLQKFCDNIEAKEKLQRQLKEQQKKREDQIKEAIRLKQEQQN